MERKTYSGRSKILGEKKDRSNGNIAAWRSK